MVVLVYYGFDVPQVADNSVVDVGRKNECSKQHHVMRRHTRTVRKGIKQSAIIPGLSGYTGHCLRVMWRDQCGSGLSGVGYRTVCEGNKQSEIISVWSGFARHRLRDIRQSRYGSELSGIK